ncbi:unnamed protein product [Staurois parvus]|uniref:Uncharacterized protein n=1 Tax=Staurois parvus TaxID=386267 RepID=A0ABN9HH18_9NEOB|nr:unnamed protein product [Staurois parvus]
MVSLGPSPMGEGRHIRAASLSQGGVRCQSHSGCESPRVVRASHSGCESPMVRVSHSGCESPMVRVTFGLESPMVRASHSGCESPMVRTSHSGCESPMGEGVTFGL